MAILKGKKRIKLGESLIKDLSLFQFHKEHVAHANIRSRKLFGIN